MPYTLNEIPPCGRGNYVVRGIGITTCYESEHLYARAREVHMVYLNAVSSKNHYIEKEKNPLVLLKAVLDGMVFRPLLGQGVYAQWKKDYGGCLITIDRCRSQLSEIKKIANNNNWEEILTFLQNF